MNGHVLGKAVGKRRCSQERVDGSLADSGSASPMAVCVSCDSRGMWTVTFADLVPAEAGR